MPRSPSSLASIAPGIPGPGAAHRSELAASRGATQPTFRPRCRGWQTSSLRQRKHRHPQPGQLRLRCGKSSHHGLPQPCPLSCPSTSAPPFPMLPSVARAGRVRPTCRRAPPLRTPIGPTLRALPASLRQLVALRSVAIAGQTLAAGGAFLLGVSLPFVPMAIIIAALLVFNLFASARLKRGAARHARRRRRPARARPRGLHGPPPPRRRIGQSGRRRLPAARGRDRDAAAVAKRARRHGAGHRVPCARDPLRRAAGARRRPATVGGARWRSVSGSASR